MTYLLNYANLKFYNKQKYNSETGLKIGQFDNVIETNIKNIDNDFYQKNKHILDCKRGAGYWLWKSYLIDKKLKEINEGDFLFYCDSGSYFISSIKPIVELCNKETKGILTFHINSGDTPDCAQTKRDTYILMNCDNENYWYKNHPHHAGFVMFKNNEFSKNFVSEWLEFGQNERIITDLKNQCGKPNLPEFITHRHDQSIYSILVKKYNIKSYVDLTQWGNPFRKNSKIPQIIQHTRNK